MLLYEIALTLVPGIGDITARKLISHCGSAEAVFREKHGVLITIPGIGESLASSLVRQKVLSRAEEELSFIHQNNIQAISISSPAYPERLRQCIDAPLVLFVKGTVDLNHTITIAVVGTRKATAYGREVCLEAIHGLSELDPMIISGLAYGIDTLSHRAALENQLLTVGVLGHGLDMIYPPANLALARNIVGAGALVTDFLSKTRPDKENFPKRNRIIAGLADAVIVVEAAACGGALITAGLANSYNRDVFAIPGRWNDEYSQGCNFLISTNRAALMRSPQDLMEAMNWKKKTSSPQSQIELMIDLHPDEELVYKILQENGESGLDLICLSSGLPRGKVSNALLQMELRRLVKALPGNRYILALAQ